MKPENHMVKVYLSQCGLVVIGSMRVTKLASFLSRFGILYGYPAACCGVVHCDSGLKIRLASLSPVAMICMFCFRHIAARQVEENLLDSEKVLIEYCSQFADRIRSAPSFFEIVMKRTDAKFSDLCLQKATNSTDAPRATKTLYSISGLKDLISKELYRYK